MAGNERDFEERRLDALRRDISARLQRVCQHIPRPEFHELVDRIARLQRKFERRSSSDFLRLAPKKDSQGRLL